MSQETTILRVSPGLAFLGLACMAGGCAAPPKQSGPPSADRLRQVYPDLESGRYLMLADFEDAAQFELFELVNASGSARLAPRPSGGRPETGGGSLVFTAGSPRDVAVIANRQGSKAYLKRDWRPYDVLLFSMHAPASGLAAEFTASGGGAGQRSTAYTSIPLQNGWNTVRLDLAEMGEQVPLDDVQELRLSIAGQGKPVDVVLDDLLLTGSREDLLGDPANKDGALYVQRVGRRWDIGAGGRFEIAVMNGQVRRWYNLASDPHRIRNLLEGGALGPQPAAVDQEGAFTPLLKPGGSLAVQQRIVEMNALRVVIEIIWRATAEQPGREPILHRWQYIIYPTGQIFAVAEATGLTQDLAAAPLGAVVSVASASPPVLAHVDQVSSTGESGSLDVPYAMTWHEASKAYLALAPAHHHASAGIVTREDPAVRLLSLVLVGGDAQNGVARWVVQLFLGDAGSSDRHDIQQHVQARVVDYTAPAPVAYAIGGPAHNAAYRPDGYDATEGCFVVQADAQRARWVVDGSRRPVFSPGFRLPGSAGRDAWVYVDHLILKTVARDAHGDLLFHLPGEISTPRLIEVVMRGDSASASP